jgi:hypothetical protein
MSLQWRKALAREIQRLESRFLRVSRAMAALRLTQSRLRDLDQEEHHPRLVVAAQHIDNAINELDHVRQLVEQAG